MPADRCLVEVGQQQQQRVDLLLPLRSPRVGKRRRIETEISFTWTTIRKPHTGNCRALVGHDSNVSNEPVTWSRDNCGSKSGVREINTSKMICDAPLGPGELVAMMNTSCSNDYKDVFLPHPPRLAHRVRVASRQEGLDCSPPPFYFLSFL